MRGKAEVHTIDVFTEIVGVLYEVPTDPPEGDLATDVVGKSEDFDETQKKNFRRSTSATLLCVVWRRFDRLELIAFRVCGKEEPGTSCGRTKFLPRALLSHHKLLGNLFWIFGLNLERAVSSSDRIFCSRTPNLGVLCTPDRPPPFCLITCQRSRTSLT